MIIAWCIHSWWKIGCKPKLIERQRKREREREWKEHLTLQNILSWIKRKLNESQWIFIYTTHTHTNILNTCPTAMKWNVEKYSYILFIHRIHGNKTSQQVRTIAWTGWRMGFYVVKTKQKQNRINTIYCWKG